VPARLAIRAGGQADRYTAVLAAMTALPEAPAAPSRPGDILVLAGETGPALALAAELAGRMRVDPAHTLVVAPTAAASGVPATRRVLTAADADRRARRLHLADVPSLLVLAAPLDRSDPDWAATMLSALRPTAVWAVVDATRKAADLARWLDGFGEVEAVAVHAAQASADPATVLGLALPVSYLDGRPASPASWAALLCERLART
jgi:hypothetical protein